MEVANYLFNNVKNINNLKLQKMMFFSYIEYYDKFHNELFEDNFQAWVYGPVLPELYYLFYKLLDTNNSFQEIKDKEIKEVLNNVIKKYGDKNAFELVDLTHEHPAWKNARNGLSSNEPSNNKINLKDFLVENK